MKYIQKCSPTDEKSNHPAEGEVITIVTYHPDYTLKGPSDGFLATEIKGNEVITTWWSSEEMAEQYLDLK